MRDIGIWLLLLLLVGTTTYNTMETRRVAKINRGLLYLYLLGNEKSTALIDQMIKEDQELQKKSRTHYTVYGLNEANKMNALAEFVNAQAS